jgi:hypothetical protein
LIEALEWMQARTLAGAEGAYEMLVEYAKVINRLVGLWRFAMLMLPARPENYDRSLPLLTDCKRLLCDQTQGRGQ